MVIQLNLVKSIRRILEAVINATPGPESPSTIASPAAPYDDRWDTSANGVAYPRMSYDDSASTMSTSTRDSNDFSDYKLRLIPLLRAEQILTEKLASPDSTDYRGDALGGREGYNHLSWSTHNSGQELFVRSGDLWKLKNGDSSKNADAVIEEASRILYRAREDMITLWQSPLTQEILSREKINLSESSGL